LTLACIIFLPDISGFTTRCVNAPKIEIIPLAADKCPRTGPIGCAARKLGSLRRSALSGLLRHIFERVVWGVMALRLVKGEGFAVDAISRRRVGS
jgi:hypothetical protein